MESRKLDGALILVFAEGFFERLPKYWQAIGVTEQKKLQAFFFPEGIIAEKAGNLRTADYNFLERLKLAIRGDYSRLVPRARIELALL